MFTKELAIKRANRLVSFFNYELGEDEKVATVKKEIKKAFEEIGMRVEFGKVKTESSKWKTTSGLPKSKKVKKLFVKIIK